MVLAVKAQPAVLSVMNFGLPVMMTAVRGAAACFAPGGPTWM